MTSGAGMVRELSFYVHAPVSHWLQVLPCTEGGLYEAIPCLKDRPSEEYSYEFSAARR